CVTDMATVATTMAAMALTTQNKAFAERAASRSSLVAGGTIALVGAVMTFLAVPHFAAGLIQIGGDPTASAIERNLPTTPDGLDTEIESRDAAIGWYDTPQYHTQIGYAEVRNYFRLDTLP